ncbi:RICIN domain-containing protein [soil metagenome]
MLRRSDTPGSTRRGAGGRRKFRTLRLIGFALAFLLLVAGAGYWLMQGTGGSGMVAEANTVPPAASSIGHPHANEAYLWRPVAVGAGGYITGMDIDRSGRTRVVRTDVHGAYIWDAAKDKWSQLIVAPAMPAIYHRENALDAGAFEIAVAPGQPLRLYLAQKGRFFRSNDGGASWMEPNANAPFPLTFDANSEYRRHGAFIAVDPDNPDMLFFGTPLDGLWRSADGAMTWQIVANVPRAADLKPAPGTQTAGIAIWFGQKAQGQRKVYAASAGHGLFMADTPTGAFRPAEMFGIRGPTTIVQGSIAPNGDFFATEEISQHAWVLRGASGWSDLTALGKLPAKPWRGVAADPRSDRVFISDGGGHIWCSSNGGESWWQQYRSVTVGPRDPPWLHVGNSTNWFESAQILFDPAVPGRLWVSSGIAPLYADVGTGCGWTLTWKTQGRGIEELVTNDIVQPPGYAPLFAAWDFGIHVKPDLNAYSTSFGPKPRVLIAAQQVEWSGLNPAFLVTNASDTRTDCCSEDGDAVLAGYSSDGGLTWTKFATLPTPPGTKPDDPWRMAFGAIAVAADNPDNIVWVPGFNKAPFFTLDRGKSWNQIHFPGEVGPNTGSYGPMFGIRKSLVADRVAPGTFYMVHNGPAPNQTLQGLWRSTDRGVSWTQVFTGEIAPFSTGYMKMRSVPGHKGHLFFTSGVIGAPDTRIRRSTDGGAHWQILDGTADIDDIGFGKPAGHDGYPTIFISGRIGGIYGMWRSTDNAVSWQRLVDLPIGRLDQVNVVEGDKDVFGRVYIGYKGSGWLYGEPAPCTPVPMKSRDDRQCSTAEAGISGR